MLTVEQTKLVPGAKGGREGVREVGEGVGRWVDDCKFIL